MMYKKLNDLDDIPNIKYQGYYWRSGDSKPVHINNEYPNFGEKSGKSLFVQEAMLWNEEEKISIMINHTGHQQINLYELTVEDLSKSKDVIHYESIRLDNRKLKFLQYWKEEEDEHCEDFSVLKMKAKIFIGFSNQIPTKNK